MGRVEERVSCDQSSAELADPLFFFSLVVPVGWKSRHVDRRGLLYPLVNLARPRDTFSLLAPGASEGLPKELRWCVCSPHREKRRSWQKGVATSGGTGDEMEGSLREMLLRRGAFGRLLLWWEEEREREFGVRVAVGECARRDGDNG